MASRNRLRATATPAALALAAALALHPGSASPAHIAAAIEYDDVARPAALPDSLHAAPGTSLRYLAIKAIDGFMVNATLWQPDAHPPADTTMIVMVHGSGGSYSSEPQLSLGPKMAAKGYASLIINTRQHDAHINTDNFLDVRRDIDAAVQVARALGYRRLVLQGHSLGNIQVQFYAATNWDADIKAVVLLGAFGNLPWKSENLLVQNDADFKRLIAAALASLRAGTQADLMPVKMHYYTGADSPMTAQHFLTYRWDKTSVADGTFWIHRIPDPILMVRDQADGVIQPFEPHMLLSAAGDEGSLVKSIDYVLLPNPKPPSLAGHEFAGDEQALADTIAGWLTARGL